MLSSLDDDYTLNGKLKGPRKGRYVHPNSEFTSTVDMDRITHFAAEIQKGPFESTYLKNAEYVACVSILDFFFALISNLDPNLCGNVRDLNIQTVNERMKLKTDAEMKMEAEADNEETSAEPLTEPTSSVAVAMEPAPEEIATEAGFTVGGRQYPQGMSVCEVIICSLLDILSTGEPVYMPLTQDGVLVLFADFCEEIRNRSGWENLTTILNSLTCVTV